MHNWLTIESVRADPVPHPLAEARFEVMSAAVAPHEQDVEALVEMLTSEQMKHGVQQEMIVILIGVRTVAEVVEVDSLSLFTFHPLQHKDAILYVYTLSTFWLKEYAGEVHQ